ncbi:hypothetical protein BH10PSE13_BH10PSE13_23890 [soil metagenome]
MLRTLIFAGIAAVAGRKLYKSGALDRVGQTLKDQADLLKRNADDRRLGIKPAHEAAGGPRSVAIVPPSLG